MTFKFSAELLNLRTI